MAKMTKRQLRKELAKKEEDLGYLMEKWKDEVERPGRYFGTVLFLNGDSAAAESALLEELKGTEEFLETIKGSTQMEAFGMERRAVVLRVIGKFNRFRDTHGQHGSNYALDLDLDELTIFRRVLDDAGIDSWEDYRTR